MRILIADDSAVYRLMLKTLLEDWEYEVVLAKDGTEALEILSGENAPRLAILDGTMPGLSGPQLCELVRRNHRDYVYTILLSANGSEEDVLQGFELGADDYLCKPFKEFELRARLNVGGRILEAQERLVKAQEALQFQATHDPMTRLLNRGGIMDILKKELNRASRTHTPLSICLADLDHFKRVNDTYGHLAGDQILQTAGARMSAVLREYDSMGRYGGEEFLVVLPGCHEEGAVAIAERLRKSMADEPLLANFQKIGITVSLGVCELQPRMDLADLLNRADQAMYQAKGAGRNRVERAAPKTNDLDILPNFYVKSESMAGVSA